MSRWVVRQRSREKERGWQGRGGTGSEQPSGLVRALAAWQSLSGRAGQHAGRCGCRGLWPASVRTPGPKPWLGMATSQYRASPRAASAQGRQEGPGSLCALPEPTRPTPALRLRRKPDLRLPPPAGTASQGLREKLPPLPSEPGRSQPPWPPPARPPPRPAPECLLPRPKPRSPARGRTGSLSSLHEAWAAPERPRGAQAPRPTLCSPRCPAPAQDRPAGRSAALPPPVPSACPLFSRPAHRPLRQSVLPG